MTRNVQYLFLVDIKKLFTHWLVKPADLSQISPATHRQLSKPADEGLHNSAWGLADAYLLAGL